jgi:hypothetical protein
MSTRIGFSGVINMAAAQHQPGKMDISSHREMWGTFITMTKWTTGIVIVIVAMMAFFLT